MFTGCGSVPSGKKAAAPKGHKKRDEYLEELRKVKARREEYEREREEREAKRVEDQRKREAEVYGDWMEKEEEFHRIQSKRRCRWGCHVLC